MNKNIIILCPGNTVTGGPELLHQLAHKLSINGINVGISYYPFNNKYKTPPEYKKYNTKNIDIIDSENSIIIIPESATILAKNIKKADIIIWWLSVDNYLGWKKESYFFDRARHLYQLIRRRKLTLSKLKNFRHLTQSEYAREFLEKNNIASETLSDYIGSNHFYRKNISRENIIAFNPKKGRLITKNIIKNNPDLNFVPLQGMSSQQVNDVLCRAKIYIDFGNHPGKDRLPREAALAGCCVITGTKGSAKNDLDIPIDKKYKISEREKCFLEKFKKLANEILTDFDSHSADFNNYRNIIKNEEHIFSNQVSMLFSNDNK